MSEWETCPNLDECINGNRFGKGCVEDAIQSAMGGKPWHECHCGVDGDGNPPNRRQSDTIARLTAENEKLRAALETVMIGGNHLVSIIGATHPQTGSHYEAALQFYGPGHKYEAWCCWNAIMDARAALSGDKHE